MKSSQEQFALHCAAAPLHLQPARSSVEFGADNPGDRPFHGHKNRHAMNAMGHKVPNVIGVDQKGVAKRIEKLVPGYMAMGNDGMGRMSEMAKMMPGPKNTLPMMSGTGRFGPIEMSGMFTFLKIREGLTNNDGPGWYQNREGTVAGPVKS